MHHNELLMPSLLDREIVNHSEDAFGHRHYARALQSLIEDPTKLPPYSIGLLSKMGKGKSSIQSLYKSGLNDDVERSKRVCTIKFNAWRHGGENIKRALLREVFIAAGGNEAELDKKLYSEQTRTELQARSVREILAEMLSKNLEVWVSASVSFLLPMLFVLIGVVVLGWVGFNAWQRIAGVITAGVFYQLFKRGGAFVPFSTAVTYKEAPATAGDQLVGLLVFQLRKFRRKHNYERLVIFVDDLDRLPAEEMVSGLDAIRVFMEIPRNEIEDLGIVFVISCDEDLVASALSDRRKATSKDMPAVQSRDDARHYLDRIFQHRLEIPPFPRQDMRAYIEKKLSAEAPLVVEKIRKQGVSLPDLTARMTHPGIQGPRNVIQIVNAFLQTWWIAEQREKEGAGVANLPGGLHEGAVTQHPVSIAILSVLKIDFPGFYADLQRDPKLLQCLAGILFHGQAAELLSEATRNTLKGYLVGLESGANSSEIAMRAEHAALQTYLRSVDGHRWPDNMQPLLMLTVDPLSRKYGDRAQPIRDHLVAGDPDKVVELLGRNKDASTLSADDVELLRGILDDLDREPAASQQNAAYALAKILPRMDAAHADAISSPITQAMMSSMELCARVGLEGIERLLRGAPLAQCRSICGILVQHLMRPNAPVSFLTPQLQVPTLDDAFEMVQQACEIVLETKSKHGLRPADHQLFLSWLVDRHVSIGGSTAQVPYSRLEGWLDGYPEVTSELNVRYFDILLAELENDKTDFSVAAALVRARYLLDGWLTGGQEGLDTAWRYLGSLARVFHGEAAQFAWQYAEEHLDRCDLRGLLPFVAALAERLASEIEDDGGLLDRDARAEALLRVVRTKVTRLDKSIPEAGRQLVRLIAAWENEGSADYGLALMDSLHAIDTATVNEVLGTWSSRVLGDLTEARIDWLGRQVGQTMADEQLAALMAQVQVFTTQVNQSEDKAGRYRRLLHAIAETDAQVPQVLAHINKLISFVQGQAAQQAFVKQVFPVIPAFLAYADRQAAGNLLVQLHANYQGNIDMMGFICKWMSGDWPDNKSGQYGSYQPLNFFNAIVNLCTNNPGHVTAVDLLAAISELTSEEIVPDGNDSKVISLACKVWPHHRQGALSAILKSRRMPDHSEIGLLASSVNLNDADAVADLRKAWLDLMQGLDANGCAEVLGQLLQSNNVASQTNPVFAVDLWVDCTGDFKGEMLKAVLGTPGLLDALYQQVWLQIVRNAKDLGANYVVQVLPIVFCQQDAHITHTRVLEMRGEVEVLFESAEQKSQLKFALLNAMVGTSSRHAKEVTASWLKAIDGEVILKEISKLNAFTMVDCEVLLNQFKGNKHLRQYANRADKE